MRRSRRHDRHPLHRPHLRRPSQPLTHHRLRGSPPLPLVPRPRLRGGPSLRIHLRLLCAQGCLPSFPFRWCHCAFCQHCSGLLHRVHHHFQSPFRRDRRRDRYSRGGRTCRNRGRGHGYAQHSYSRAIQWGINESGPNSRTGGRSRQLQTDMDISGGADCRCCRRSCGLHSCEAEGRRWRDAATELPPLNGGFTAACFQVIIINSGTRRVGLCFRYITDLCRSGRDIKFALCKSIS
ncbi:hypothetical protein MUK42_25567 [Musa troglodytarum]|uniref:Uncharacterized protein n=1 Tax=Musa troglodytarum TaxID=320322 RepID=A0A9E7H853_9LILI|nr:hypothetical protein MUK42_25567 [Musa troglodytarum]